MQDVHDVLFKTLADPTRRAIFERLRREGEKTVRGADSAGWDLATGRLKASWRTETGRAGARSPAGRQTHYRAQPSALAPLIDWTSQLARVLAKLVQRSGRLVEADGPMNESSAETRSVVVEREIPYPPEKIWRALTQPFLIAEWLMKNDFKPDVGHRFNLRGEWGGVLDCEVLAIEPNRSLSYTWNFKHDDAAYNLQSEVTFTRTPTPAGTHLRIEQWGFRPHQKQAYGGARHGWQEFFEKLQQVLAQGQI